MEAFDLFRVFLSNELGKSGRGSQKLLGKKAGIPPADISHFLHGHKMLGENRREQLAMALGFNYEDALKKGRLLSEKKHESEIVLIEGEREILMEDWKTLYYEKKQIAAEQKIIIDELRSRLDALKRGPIEKLNP